MASLQFRLIGRPAIALGLAAWLASAACGPPDTPFVSLDRDLSPLRDVFNGDAGRVRVLMLVAPT